MIRGYVSSDEDDYDDFGYSEPLVVRETKTPPVEVHSEKLKIKLDAAMKRSQKIELFLKAASEEDFELLEELISLGVSVDETEPQKWTALMNACGAGKHEVVEFLLQHGSNPNHHKELFTPLMACCTDTLVAEDLKLQCVRLLLENGAEVNATDKYRTSALMYACGSGYLDIVTQLLRVPGINVSVQDKEGWSALFHAVNSNNIEIVKILLSFGLNQKIRDKHQRTAVDLAVDKDFIEMAKVLGYVEENVLTPLNRMEKPGEKFLDELPLPNGEGGYYSDAKHILSLFNQHNVERVSLPDFLNMTRKTLSEIGVKVKYDQDRILSQGIHRYHLHPWTKSSMPEIVQGQVMSMETAIAIMGCIAKHLTIANASLRYLNTRMKSRLQPGRASDQEIHKSFLFHITNTCRCAWLLNSSLPKILRHINEIKPEASADYIYKYDGSKGRLKKYFWYTIGTTIIVAFVVNYSTPLMGHMANFLIKFSSVTKPKDRL